MSGSKLLSGWRSNAVSSAALSHGWPTRQDDVVLRGIRLESGATLPPLRVHYWLAGTIAPARDNVALVIHALTGTAEAGGWWKGVIHAGGAIDPTRHAVLCANLLGGSNGTALDGHQHAAGLPTFTTRDQAAVLAALLDALDIEAPAMVCGGSLGGMVALEFAASFPTRTRSVVVLAAPAAQTALGLAWNAIMRRAIEIGGEHDGLALARMIGMLSYRTPVGLEERFGRKSSGSGTSAVGEWLAMHGEKLVARFDASSYLTLVNAMDTHDVGRGRGGVRAALAHVADRVTGVGVVGDLLYPAESVREWTTAIAAHHEDLHSPHGHDAFLLETARVSAIIRDAFARSR